MSSNGEKYTCDYPAGSASHLLIIFWLFILLKRELITWPLLKATAYPHGITQARLCNGYFIQFESSIALSVMIDCTLQFSSELQSCCRYEPYLGWLTAGEIAQAILGLFTYTKASCSNKNYPQPPDLGLLTTGRCINSFIRARKQFRFIFLRHWTKSQTK